MGPVSGKMWRLGRRPALDGIRGLAVALVVVSHVAGVGRLDVLGKVGVTIFFVLSGFLITSLLAEEHETEGHIRIGSFYARRARRLLPALVALVLITLLIQVNDGGGFIRVPMLVGALTYSANWVKISGADTNDALGHTWSLSVEEQFYLVWPLLLVCLLRITRESRLRWVIGAIVVTSSLPLVYLAMGDSFDRVLYGSDTRAMPLLVGCLLAFLMHGSTERPRSAVLSILPLALVTVLSLWIGYLLDAHCALPGRGTAHRDLALDRGARPPWLARTACAGPGRAQVLRHLPLAPAVADARTQGDRRPGRGRRRFRCPAPGVRVGFLEVDRGTIPTQDDVPAGRGDGQPGHGCPFECGSITK